MMMAKIKGATTLLIALAVLGLGSGVVAERVIEAKQRALVSSTEPVTAAERSASPKPQQGTQTRTDAYGDPLPATAIRRVGTLRFRKEGYVNCLLPTPDGKTLVSGSGMQSQFGDLTLWDTATGKEKMTLHNLKNWVEDIQFSADGKLMASGGGFQGSQGELKLWTAGK